MSLARAVVIAAVCGIEVLKAVDRALATPQWVRERYPWW